MIKILEVLNRLFYYINNFLNTMTMDYIYYLKRIFFFFIFSGVINIMMGENISTKALFVANNGRDKNKGCIDAPFKTLERAIEEVYNLKGKKVPLDSIVIYLREGVYELGVPLILTSEKLHNVKLGISAYLNETVVISGGKQSSNWNKYDKNKELYYVSLSPKNKFRQLYYGEKEKAIRAKGVLKSKFYLKNDKIVTDKVNFSTWKNPDKIEFVSNREWSQTRALISSITLGQDSCYLFMKQPNYSFVRNLHSMVYFDSPDWVENAFELIDEPGEWYLDEQQHTLYLQDDNLKTILKEPIIIPQLEQLIVLRGTPNNPIRNVSFHNIRFSHTTWNQPSKIGFASIQANQLEYPYSLKKDYSVTIPAAVDIEYGNNIFLKDCSFCQLGGTGLNISKSKDCKINRCTFYNIAGSGIQILGYVYEPFPEESDICERIEIKNNLIDNVSNEYYGGVGIFVGYARNIQIINNELSNLPYTAISIGWGWGVPSICMNNIIENNYIHDYMTQLRDGAGVYTLGNQPGSSCKNNYICNMIKQYWGGGMYFDEGSGGFTVENNVIENVLNWIFCHKAKNILINNNYSKIRDVLFIRSKDCIMNNTHNIYTNEWPDEAQSIINKAGIQK